MVSIAIRLEHLERFQFIEKLEALYVRTVDKIKFSLIRRPIFHIAPWSLRKYTVVPLEAIPPPQLETPNLKQNLSMNPLPSRGTNFRLRAAYNQKTDNQKRKNQIISLEHVFFFF